MDNKYHEWDHAACWEVDEQTARFAAGLSMDFYSVFGASCYSYCYAVKIRTGIWWKTADDIGHPGEDKESPDKFIRRALEGKVGRLLPN